MTDTDTDRKLTADDHETAYREAHDEVRRMCQQVAVDAGPSFARELRGAALAMSTASRRYAAAVARDRHHRQLGQVAEWMWNAHRARHRDSCRTRTHERDGYHADPLMCACFQGEEPHIRNVLAIAAVGAAASRTT